MIFCAIHRQSKKWARLISKTRGQPYFPLFSENNNRSIVRDVSQKTLIDHENGIQLYITLFSTNLVFPVIRHQILYIVQRPNVYASIIRVFPAIFFFDSIFCNVLQPPLRSTPFPTTLRRTQTLYTEDYTTAPANLLEFGSGYE